MRFLLLGFLTGAICALVALALGARWWMILLTYAIAGTLGTEVVLAEIAALAVQDGPLTMPETVPFFDNRTPQPRFARIA
ncbi:hypothetical protein DPM13_16790 [Paracoccus mutanolyticus]|uniref:Uncharacterized protein n=1 Tax=Paracoccus mutanolyticus TaxID=1499308 RepID=A0ABM6WTM3_9RHOB|nr:hypothetical protein [Paracoccus mutanolyticus]AWX94045.1 hypothetical protein DPM13_16790 [Paracoccus mutanolyticus]